VGSSLNKESLTNVGWRPFTLAMSLWVVLGVGSLVYVMD
jgi:uncharacterized membrane protein YadS